MATHEDTHARRQAASAAGVLPTQQAMPLAGRLKAPGKARAAPAPAPAPAPSAATKATKPAAKKTAPLAKAVKPQLAVKPAKGAKGAKVASAAKTAKPAKLPKPAKPPKVRPRLVRDGFTMPEADFSLLASLKARALAAQRETKKSELLRAGLHALDAMDAKALLAALNALEPVKIGRPGKLR